MMPTVLETYEDGEKTDYLELVQGDNPATPEVETSWWRRVLNFTGV